MFNPPSPPSSPSSSSSSSSSSLFLLPTHPGTGQDEKERERKAQFRAQMDAAKEERRENSRLKKEAELRAQQEHLDHMRFQSEQVLPHAHTHRRRRTEGRARERRGAFAGGVKGWGVPVTNVGLTVPPRVR